MIQPDNTQTRKDEIRFRTSDIRRIVGKFLACNAQKSWNEEILSASPFARNAIVDKAFCLTYKEQEV